jgi:hypothetical protein
MNARPGVTLTLLTTLLAGCSGAATPPATASPPPEPQGVLDVAPARAEAAPAPQASPAPGAINAKSGPAAAKVTDHRPRLAAVEHFAYIYRKPEATGLALGYIRMGTAVPLKSDKPVPGKGCKRGWYAVEPRGFACLNHTTTLDLQDPYYLALQTAAPEPDSVWYYHYAYSNDAPMYSRVPTREETEKEDKKFGPRGSHAQLAEWARGHEELLVKDPIVATDPVPDIFAGGKRHVGARNRDPHKLQWRMIPNGSILAYAKAFEYDGRVWLMTPDLMLVPADRVRKMHRSEFHGARLEGGLSLPLAWNRTKGQKPLYRRQLGGALAPVPGALASKTFVPIAEDKITEGGKAYFPVRGQPDLFVEEGDVTVSRARKTLPQGVEPGQKWIEAKILPGTLTLYEGTTPIYASLFSPGKGGVPAPGNDNTVYATTQVGFFPVEWKERVATMTNEMGEPKVAWFTDVPHIQYLRAPLAMHVAFWHEDFGNPKSAECVNISPEDGRVIFNWTDPALPEGWGGMRPGGGNGKSTPVVITAR